MVAMSFPQSDFGVRATQTAFLENRARASRYHRMPHFCLGWLRLPNGNDGMVAGEALDRFEFKDSRQERCD